MDRWFVEHNTEHRELAQLHSKMVPALSELIGLAPLLRRIEAQFVARDASAFVSAPGPLSLGEKGQEVSKAIKADDLVA